MISVTRDLYSDPNAFQNKFEGRETLEEKSQNGIDITARLFEGQREFWENWMKATNKGTDTVQSIRQERTNLDMLTTWNQTWLK